MTGKKEFNDYEVLGDITNIIIKRKNGDIHKVIIDTEDLQLFIDLNYNWMVDTNNKRNCIHVICKRYICVENGKTKHFTKGIHQYLIKANPEQGEYIDHIDGDGLNNCKNNLRVISNKGNLTNLTRKNKNNKSGYRNVCWNNRQDQWCVQLQLEGKNTILGFFNNVDVAGAYAEEMREKYYKPLIEQETIHNELM